MQLFYDPDLQPGTHPLREVEARHAFQVLRKKVGDRINLVNGRGSWFSAEVAAISKRECLLDVSLVREPQPRAKHQLHLLVAPTKNIDRFEWILEKATEIGIDFIQPILTEHSERKRIRTDRLERVLEAAMKQSLRAWKPELGELLPFERAMELTNPDHDRFLAYLGADGTPLLHESCRKNTSVTIAIGPEGGFSPAEAEMARSHGYKYASLGPNRLRTETAAIAAVHTIEQLNW
ncbi:RsmE family RNA methyltransferase [Neolewinella aurantiaca]|uniref:RsmE family RNA methyltransferase n=1 Tax=Neolewinella aurantiaca TaxID=2602767 RepID=UPI00164F932E|nr:RsmE family RNA methyltransferase [Neolewinella aurantiaca]